MTVGEILGEPPLHAVVPPGRRRERVAELLTTVACAPITIGAIRTSSPAASASASPSPARSPSNQS